MNRATRDGLFNCCGSHTKSFSNHAFMSLACLKVTGAREISNVICLMCLCVDGLWLDQELGQGL